MESDIGKAAAVGKDGKKAEPKTRQKWGAPKRRVHTKDSREE